MSHEKLLNRRKIFFEDNYLTIGYNLSHWITETSRVMLQDIQGQQKISAPSSIMESTLDRSSDQNPSRNSVEDQRYPCGRCGGWFWTQNALIMHCLTNHEFWCRLCNVQFTTQQQLYKHISEKHLTTKYCVKCKIGFRTMEIAQKHMFNLHSEIKDKFPEQIPTETINQLTEEIDVKPDVNDLLTNMEATTHIENVSIIENTSQGINGTSTPVLNSIENDHSSYTSRATEQPNMIPEILQNPETPPNNHQQQIKNRLHDAYYKCNRCNIRFHGIQATSKHMKLEHDVRIGVRTYRDSGKQEIFVVTNAQKNVTVHKKAIINGQSNHSNLVTSQIGNTTVTRRTVLVPPSNIEVRKSIDKPSTQLFDTNHVVVAQEINNIEGALVNESMNTSTVGNTSSSQSNLQPGQNLRQLLMQGPSQPNFVTNRSASIDQMPNFSMNSSMIRVDYSPSPMNGLSNSLPSNINAVPNSDDSLRNQTLPAEINSSKSNGELIIKRKPVGTLECDICGRFYSRKDSLRRHKRQKHSMIISVDKNVQNHQQTATSSSTPVLPVEPENASVETRTPKIAKILSPDEAAAFNFLSSENLNSQSETDTETTAFPFVEIKMQLSPDRRSSYNSVVIEVEEDANLDDDCLLITTTPGNDLYDLEQPSTSSEINDELEIVETQNNEVITVNDDDLNVDDDDDDSDDDCEVILPRGVGAIPKPIGSVILKPTREFEQKKRKLSHPQNKTKISRQDIDRKIQAIERELSRKNKSIFKVHTIEM